MSKASDWGKMWQVQVDGVSKVHATGIGYSDDERASDRAFAVGEGGVGRKEVAGAAAGIGDDG